MNKQIPQELVEECAELIIKNKKPVDELKTFRDLDLEGRKACLCEAQVVAQAMHYGCY